MMMERALKILMTVGLAVLCALIAIGNFTYPDLNEKFVQHVLSMDTVEGPIAVHGVRSPLIWEVGFWSIVGGEALTAGTKYGMGCSTWFPLRRAGTSPSASACCMH